MEVLSGLKMTPARIHSINTRIDTMRDTVVRTEVKVRLWRSSLLW